jgi:hypothetical protein
MKTLAVVALLAQTAGGVGDLLVAPTFVAMDGRQRTAEVSLINIGTQPSTYRLEYRHLVMKENGELVAAEAPEGFADSMIVFSPRQVTLSPHVAQTVRIRVTLPPELATGEYRTHLQFRGVPVMPESSTTDDFRVQIVPVFGVAIPLLVRNGKTDVRVAIRDAKYVADSNSASFLLQRDGNRSVYGDVTVHWQPRGGAESLVGVINKVAIYTPLSLRQMNIPLKKETAFRGGTLRVTYVDAESRDAAVLAETAIELP